jgi:hypothetical protein
MVMVAEADLVVSVTEVAVTVTVFEAAGAVYVVGEPLPVAAGLNEPHGEVLQVTVQVTPALLLSFATTAVRGVDALVASDVGGAVKVTEIAGGIGGVVEPDPPQEVRQMDSAAMAKRGVVWRHFIGCLRSVRSG